MEGSLIDDKMYPYECEQAFVQYGLEHKTEKEDLYGEWNKFMSQRPKPASAETGPEFIY